MDIAAGIDEQNLSIFDALNLNLLLDSRGDGEGGYPFEFVFLARHGFQTGGERSS